MSVMNENLAPGVLRRLAKDVAGLIKSSPDGIRVHPPADDDWCEVQATIAGPQGTPFEGGEFTMRLVFGSDFPQCPPKGFFMTKIFHPNVAPSNGEICVNTLKRDWNPKNGLDHILTVVKCLLIAPNAESALNEEAGKLLLEEYDEFSRRAKLHTSIHAMPKGSSAAASGSSSTSEKTSSKTKESSKKDKSKDKKKDSKKKSLKRL